MILQSFYRMIILVVISCSVLFLCLHPLEESKFGPYSDEGYYYQYAQVISHQGVQGFHHLIKKYASSEEARQHPAPVRIGYISLSAILFKIFGPSYGILALISLFSFLIFLLINYYFARKHFGLDSALLFVSLLASSPLMLGLSRRVLLDSSNNLFWGLLVWLFLDFLLKPSRLKYIIFLILLCLAMTFKEMSVVLLPFFFIFSIIAKYFYKINLRWFQIFGILILPGTVLLLVYLMVFGVGDVGMMISSVAQTHFMPSTNVYANQYSSGPWFRYLLDFLLLSPLTLIFFIGYVFHLFSSQDADLKKVYFLSYFIIIYGFLNSLGHSKVVRFVVNLDMVINLFSVFMIIELSRRIKAQWRQVFVSCVIIFICVVNLQGFILFFEKNSILDTISYNLLVARDFFYDART